MMGIYGFKTKKELKAAVGQPPHFVETSFFGTEFKGDGEYTVDCYATYGICETCGSEQGYCTNLATTSWHGWPSCLVHSTDDEAWSDWMKDYKEV